MKIYNTRFNPTANGPLHLGHVYMLLFNEYQAHHNGGEFVVRFEDNQVDTLYSVPSQDMRAFADGQREAIDWLEIPVDRYYFQSQMDVQLKEFIAHHDWFMPEYKWPYSIPLNPVYGYYDPERGEWFPYAPFVTYAKVCYDAICNTNLLIRGDDLRSEFSLYQHYRQMLRLPQIDHYYLPRLYTHADTILSKFNGAKSILDYRQEGWNPDDLKTLLAQSCLKDPAQGWHLFNVQRYPRLHQGFG